jgi:hypothetical protein
MQQSRSVNRLQWNRFSAVGAALPLQVAVPQPRYRRILLCLSLNPPDRASLLLSFELAALHRSALTLLHVLPPAKGGLDAFDLLHRAVDEFRRPLPDDRPCKAARSRVRAFINDVVPSHLLSAVCWQEVGRPGELAEAVVAEAKQSAADLVILSPTPFRWWLPRVFDTWAIRRRTRASVIVIRP